MALHDLTPQLRTRMGRMERLVGVFLLLTLLLMVAGFGYYLRHTAKNRGWFLTKVPYYTYIADATGLKVGAPVTMMGFTIGEVTLVDQMPMDLWYLTNKYNVFIGFKVVEPYDGYILTDSKVRVGAGDFFGRSFEVTRGLRGLVTVQKTPGKSPHLLSDAFRYDTSITNREYIPLEKSKNGFWLAAEEAAPLQQRLTEIATSVNDALPGVFAMTNQVSAALTNLTLITAQLSATMPKMDAAVGDLRSILMEVRPALSTPGGIGNLVIPTNLNTELTLTLSNLNPANGPIGITLSNLNIRMADVGVALSNVNQQLSANTNLVANANQVTHNVAVLTDSINTLFRRHWIFRSAYKTNTSELRALTNAPGKSSRSR